MRKLFLVALPIGIAVAIATSLLSSGRERAAAADAKLERARLKRDFSERAGMTRGLAADRLPEWRDEVQALSRWYFDELGAIRNRHPGEPPRPTAVEVAREDKKAPSEKELAQLKDFQAYADGRLAILREQRYAPVASALADGLRLDLIEVAPGPSPEGGAPALKLEAALWGAPRVVERDRSGEKIVTRTVVPVAFKRIAFRFLDAGGKPYGEMSGGGEPYQKLVDPERFQDDFPPGMLFGTWWVELFPREAATVELELAADLRGSAGTARPVVFTYKLPVPEAWKLPPGAVYQAETREQVSSP
jgi:hypothetical protein